MAVDQHQAACRLTGERRVGVADLLRKPAERGGLARTMAAPVARIRNQLARGNAPQFNDSIAEGLARNFHLSPLVRPPHP